MGLGQSRVSFNDFFCESVYARALGQEYLFYAKLLYKDGFTNREKEEKSERAGLGRSDLSSVY